MTVKDTAKEVALGGTIGAITGPIGAAAGLVSKTAPVLVQVGARVAAGSAAGATSGAISEVARGVQGEDVTVSSVVKSVGFGALVGTVGGASSQVAGFASTKVSSEVGRAVTRVAVQGSSAAGTDAVIQLVQNGEVDPTRLLLNTTGQLTVAATAEVTSSAAQRTKAYANKVSEQNMKQTDLTPDEIKDIKLKLDEANRNDIKKGIDDIKNQQKANQRVLRQIKANNQQKSLTKEDYNRLVKPKTIGESHIHPVMNGKKIAADFGPNDGPYDRPSARVTMEEHKGNYIYSKHNRDHDYNAMKGSVLKDISDPLNNVLRNDQINAHLMDEDDDEQVKNQD